MHREVATGFGDMEAADDLEKTRSRAMVRMETDCKEEYKSKVNCLQSILFSGS